MFVSFVFYHQICMAALQFAGQLHVFLELKQILCGMDQILYVHVNIIIMNVFNICMLADRIPKNFYNIHNIKNAMPKKILHIYYFCDLIMFQPFRYLTQFFRCLTKLILHKILITIYLLQVLFDHLQNHMLCIVFCTSILLQIMVKNLNLDLNIVCLNTNCMCYLPLHV